MRKRIVPAAIAALLAAGTMGPPSNAQEAQQQEPSRVERSEQCRFKNHGDTRFWTYQKVVLTIECASEALEPIGGLSKALDVFNCETPAIPEPPHTDSYHGPFQYLKSTFHSQQSAMPGVVNRYDLPRRVHSPRANVVTAIAWARWSWSPWACA
jgi:hypothetical protein